MSNMLRIGLKKEQDYVVSDNHIQFQKESIGYNVYAYTDEVECWIGSCNDIESLEEIISEEELISSIEESASEREMDILFPALECNNYIYDFFGKLRVAARVR